MSNTKFDNQEFEDWLLCDLKQIPDEEAERIVTRKNRKSRRGLWRKSRAEKERRKRRTQKNQE